MNFNPQPDNDNLETGHNSSSNDNNDGTRINMPYGDDSMEDMEGDDTYVDPTQCEKDVVGNDDA